MKIGLVFLCRLSFSLSVALSKGLCVFFSLVWQAIASHMLVAWDWKVISYPRLCLRTQ